MGDQHESLLPNGVVAPILTPFEFARSVAHERSVALAPRRLDLAGVETVIRQILLWINNRGQLAAGQVEPHEADARAKNQVAFLRRYGQTGFFADVPGFIFACGWIEAADAGTLDVHPDQVLRLRSPHGALTKNRFRVQNTIRLQRLHGCSLAQHLATWQVSSALGEAAAQRATIETSSVPLIDSLPVEFWNGARSNSGITASK